MIEAEQMKKAVHDECPKFILDGPLVVHGLFLGGHHRDDDIAEVMVGWSGHVELKAQNVGWSVDVPPFLVEPPYRGVTCEAKRYFDGALGHRADVLGTTGRNRFAHEAFKRSNMVDAALQLSDYIDAVLDHSILPSWPCLVSAGYRAVASQRTRKTFH